MSSIYYTSPSTIILKSTLFTGVVRKRFYMRREAGSPGDTGLIFYTDPWHIEVPKSEKQRETQASTWMMVKSVLYFVGDEPCDNHVVINVNHVTETSVYTPKLTLFRVCCQGCYACSRRHVREFQWSRHIRFRRQSHSRRIDQKLDERHRDDTLHTRIREMTSVFTDPWAAVTQRRDVISTHCQMCIVGGDHGPGILSYLRSTWAWMP